jgi:hypothetical protein
VTRSDRNVAESIKRAVWLHSYGRCQYRGCHKRLVQVDSLTGEITRAGDYAHILPVGHGPRAAFKLQYPDVDLNSAANIMLLCPDHHRSIDSADVVEHPPDILFRMKEEKSALIDEFITDMLVTDAATHLGIQDYCREYEPWSIVALLRQARHLGPRQGHAVFRHAEEMLGSLLKNPFAQTEKRSVAFVRTEYLHARLFITYRTAHWREAFDHAVRELKRPAADQVLPHLLSCSIALVRDEYSVLRVPEKMELISLLSKAIDQALSDAGEDSRAAFMLLAKSAVLRWRGRFELGAKQHQTYREAVRCAEKSRRLMNSASSVLQLALAEYSDGRAFSYRERPKHEACFARCLELLESRDLTDFPAAMKYRPRIFRETYHFAKSRTAFCDGASIFPGEFMRTAYILGETVVGEYHHAEHRDAEGIAEAESFLLRAIVEYGYGHARNVAAHIHCRSILDQDWFCKTVLDGLFDKRGDAIPWEALMSRVGAALYGDEGTGRDQTLGLDEGEFWNTMGEIVAWVIRAPDKAIRLFQIAEKHAEVSGGRFRSLVGLARAYREKGDRQTFARYVDLARHVARAHQGFVISELQEF